MAVVAQHHRGAQGPEDTLLTPVAIPGPHALLTSMCSPSLLPLREKLEQLSISSVPVQRATAVACRVSPERADHTERQYSCSSAMGTWGQ